MDSEKRFHVHRSRWGTLELNHLFRPCVPKTSICLVFGGSDRTKPRYQTWWRESSNFRDENKKFGRKIVTINPCLKSKEIISPHPSVKILGPRKFRQTQSLSTPLKSPETDLIFRSMSKIWNSNAQHYLSFCLSTVPPSSTPERTKTHPAYGVYDPYTPA